jgi:outer membrane protein assembly factor BamB
MQLKSDKRFPVLIVDYTPQGRDVVYHSGWMGLTALDGATGAQLWSFAADGKSAYSPFMGPAFNADRTLGWVVTNTTNVKYNVSVAAINTATG